MAEVPLRLIPAFVGRVSAEQRFDRNGKVIGAIGSGMGIEAGQFIEAGFFQFDKQGNICIGDTSVGRVAKISPPAGK